MAITVTHTCDKCGHTQPTDNQMWSVAVIVGYKEYGGSASPARKAYWCRACVEGVGLLTPNPKPAVVPTPPSLEDVIREIIGEIVAETVASAVNRS